MLHSKPFSDFQLLLDEINTDLKRSSQIHSLVPNLEFLLINPFSPLSDKDKIDQIVNETKGNRNLTNNLAEDVFKPFAPATSALVSKYRCMGR